MLRAMGVGLIGAMFLGGCVPIATSAPTATTEFLCNPGETVNASCGCNNVGIACSGDPVIEICDGVYATCESSSALVTNDDYCGLCPLAAGVCPASGRIGVRARAFGSRTYTCRFDAIGGDGRRLPTAI